MSTPRSSTKMIPKMKNRTGIVKYFAYDHLPEYLQVVSKPFGDLANSMDLLLPNGDEKAAGMRKLLEAKDCFVRAALEKSRD